MPTEKLPAIETGKIEIKPGKKETENLETTPSQQESTVALLVFSENEKKEVIQKIIQDYTAQGHPVDETKINFPTDPKEIEGWIVNYPQYFSSQRLTEMVLRDTERAIPLIKELAFRNDYGALEKILMHHRRSWSSTSDHSIFEHCVKAIEANLDGQALENDVLMALSSALAKIEQQEEPPTIAEHESTMKKEKKTARPLEEYQKLLKISDQELAEFQGKEILLVGGGLSPVKKALKDKGIECSVTNIDPIAKPDENTADVIISEDFFKTSLEANKYDEMLSLHSLPTYAFTPKQVNDFYTRSLLALNQNGVLRVMPVYGFSDNFSPAMRLSRKPVNTASKQFIERLRTRPDLFLITEFSAEHKGFFGKSQVPGVNIKAIAPKDQIKDFLG